MFLNTQFIIVQLLLSTENKSNENLDYLGSEMKSATQFMTYLPNRVRFMNFWLQAITRPLGRVPGQTGYLGMPTSSKLSVSALR